MGCLQRVGSLYMYSIEAKAGRHAQAWDRLLSLSLQQSKAASEVQLGGVREEKVEGS